MSESKYYLQRTFRASSRLNSQHQTFGYTQPYLIHPSVVLDACAKIADVGTGTGIWLLDLARHLPKTTSLTGFDLDLSQSPNPSWLPSNVTMQRWDLFDPVPAQFRHLHDVTHARFFIQVVREGNAGPVLEQLKALTKPGGYIQWTEPNVWSMRLVKASEDIDASSTEKLCHRMRSFLTERAGSSPGWAPKLPETFRDHGLQDVQVDHFTPPTEAWPSHLDNVLLTLEEISHFVPDGESLRQLVEGAAAEMHASSRGIAIIMDSLNVIGKVGP